MEALPFPEVAVPSAVEVAAREHLERQDQIAIDRYRRDCTKL